MGADQETISVAELSDGPPMGSQPDEPVDLPVVEILTGRGFITGKSGSGKSNTASVVTEKLLDSGFGILIVDIDGEYYGLKEEYEILHVGADEECDIQVTVEHAEKIASLALEQNVPIILDVSSFLDEEEAEELLTEVAKQLFAKEKKLKQPFLMLVEEVHEWIPEKGSMSECGKMLIKIGKRGRKHGLGMVGISQRPADVKKDFITQCDWLVWHRLTWNNDTKVVSRILDGEYADAVEDLNDGEAFMMNDWSETVRRVQFHRKQTFDAGATPGLDDVDRPDLKSVSSDLVSELEEISDEKQQTENRIKELREELDKKNSRIAELEAELQDARDMSRMADEFVDALVENVKGTNPGRTAQERMREKRALRNGYIGDDEPEKESEPQPDQATLDTAGTEYTAATGDDPGAETEGDAESAVGEAAAADDGDPAEATADDDVESVFDAADAGDADTDDEAEDETESPAADTNGGVVSDTDTGERDTPAPPDVDIEMGADATAVGGASDNGHTTDSNGNSNGNGSADADVAGAMAMVAETDTETVDSEAAPEDESAGASPAESEAMPQAGQELVDHLRTAIESMEPKARRMLRYYRHEGPAKPLDAHFAGGGDGDRTNAYAHNRTLRTHGFIEHVGRGHYDYRIPDLLADEYPGTPDDEALDALVDATETALEQ